MQLAIENADNSWTSSSQINKEYYLEDQLKGLHFILKVPDFDTKTQNEQMSRNKMEFLIDSQSVKNKEHLSIFLPKIEDSLEYQYENMEEFWKIKPSAFLEQNMQIKLGESLQIFKVSEELYNINSLKTLDDSFLNTKLNQNDNKRKKLGRKFEFTGLSQRKDVVLKSLLRKIKKYLWVQLNQFTEFLYLRKSEEKDFYERCLIAFIQNTIQKDVTVDFLFTLGSFLSPDHMKVLIKRKQSKFLKISEYHLNLRKINEVVDLLYKFNLQRFIKFAQRKEVYVIINHFYNFFEDTLRSDEIIGIQLLVSMCKVERDY